MSLIASTASAAIPDANGVIHGCYNALTGSTRIIDGNNCGLLEKAVTWSQTGARGPAGASVTGQSLPVGDSHCKAGGVALTLSGTTSYICNAVSANDAIEMGWDLFTISGPIAAHTDVSAYSDSRPFTPVSNDATCIYNISGEFIHSVPGVTYTPQLRTARGEGTVTLSYATATFPDGGDTVQTHTTAGWYLQDVTDYAGGVELHVGDDPVPASSYVNIWLTWICRGGPNQTPH